MNVQWRARSRAALGEAHKVPVIDVAFGSLAAVAMG
jgi:hypothetical protein